MGLSDVSVFAPKRSNRSGGPKRRPRARRRLASAKPMRLYFGCRTGKKSLALRGPVAAAEATASAELRLRLLASVAVLRARGTVDSVAFAPLNLGPRAGVAVLAALPIVAAIGLGEG